MNIIRLEWYTIHIRLKNFSKLQKSGNTANVKHYYCSFVYLLNNWSRSDNNAFGKIMKKWNDGMRDWPVIEELLIVFQRRCTCTEQALPTETTARRCLQLQMCLNWMFVQKNSSIIDLCAVRAGKVVALAPLYTVTSPIPSFIFCVSTLVIVSCCNVCAK